MSINDDVVQSWGHVASMRRLSEGVAAAVEAETAAFLDGQDMAGAVGRRAAQVLREPWSAEADRDAVALKRPVVVAASNTRVAGLIQKLSVVAGGSGATHWRM
jgi:hypothetical protein